MQPPPIGMDPLISRICRSEPKARPHPEQYRESRKKEAIAGMLIPDAIEFNEAEAAGLPRNSRPYKLTWNRPSVSGSSTRVSTSSSWRTFTPQPGRHPAAVRVPTAVLRRQISP